MAGYDADLDAAERERPAPGGYGTVTYFDIQEAIEFFARMCVDIKCRAGPLRLQSLHLGYGFHPITWFGAPDQKQSDPASYLARLTDLSCLQHLSLDTAPLDWFNVWEFPELTSFDFNYSFITPSVFPNLTTLTLTCMTPEIHDWINISRSMFETWRIKIHITHYAKKLLNRSPVSLESEYIGHGEGWYTEKVPGDPSPEIVWVRNWADSSVTFDQHLADDVWLENEGEFYYAKENGSDAAEAFTMRPLASVNATPFRAGDEAKYGSKPDIFVFVHREPGDDGCIADQGEERGSDEDEEHEDDEDEDLDAEGDEEADFEVESRKSSHEGDSYMESFEEVQRMINGVNIDDENDDVAQARGFVWRGLQQLYAHDSAVKGDEGARSEDIMDIHMMEDTVADIKDTKMWKEHAVKFYTHDVDRILGAAREASRILEAAREVSRDLDEKEKAEEEARKTKEMEAKVDKELIRLDGRKFKLVMKPKVPEPQPDAVMESIEAPDAEQEDVKEAQDAEKAPAQPDEMDEMTRVRLFVYGLSGQELWYQHCKDWEALLSNMVSVAESGEAEVIKALLRGLKLLDGHLTAVHLLEAEEESPTREGRLVPLWVIRNVVLQIRSSELWERCTEGAGDPLDSVVAAEVRRINAKRVPPESPPFHPGPNFDSGRRYHEAMRPFREWGRK